MRIIELHAFSKTAWRELTIPAQVLEIEGYAFSSCKKAKKVVIESANTRIDPLAFEGTEVTLDYVGNV